MTGSNITTAEQDPNIWMELGNLSMKGLAFDPQTKEVRAGTINRLVERITDNDKFSKCWHSISCIDKPLDKDFMKAFLMTHKSFTDSRTLFRKLCERYALSIDQAEIIVDTEYLPMKGLLRRLSKSGKSPEL